MIAAPPLQAGTPALMVLGQNGTALRALARTLAVVFSIQTATLAGSAGLVPARFDGIIITVHGLGDNELMRQTAAALHPFLMQGLPVLAVADNPEGKNAVRARLLGASAVLPTSMTARVLTQSVRRLLGLRPATGSDPDQPLQEIVLTLDDLMQASARGRPPSPALARHAVADMRHAIAADGVARWLEQVRTVHDRTYRHSLLVAGLMAGFAQSFRFPEEDMTTLLTGALLHDVGKTLIPTEIIDKPGRLTDTEMSQMRQHAALGYDLLTADGGYDPIVLSIVRSHHEYLDGSGYPDGLRGVKIPDPVRIATLCDIFAALIEERSYKAALSPVQASDQMTAMSGKLDTDLLRAFEKVFVR